MCKNVEKIMTASKMLSNLIV